MSVDGIGRLKPGAKSRLPDNFEVVCMIVMVVGAPVAAIAAGILAVIFS